MPTSNMETFDLVVVGATRYGLPVAKTFQQIHPTENLLILDEAHSIGGTWAKERLYDDLYSNNIVGMFEYSDLPMDFETFGVPKGQHIPGDVVHAYFQAYARKFDLLKRIQFRSRVTSVRMEDDGTWLIKLLRDGETSLLRARKLVLATGTTSEPNMPSFEGEANFGGKIMHSKELRYSKTEAEALGSRERVAVLRGSKSAVDAVYMYASRGVHVDWIIRGKGPAWLSNAYVSPFKLHFEKLATTRFITFFSPCFDNDAYPSIRRFFHNTRIGRAITRGFFSIINSDLIQRGEFRKHPETEKLIPPNNIIWSGTSVGIFTHPTNFFGLIQSGLVNIHRADITSLSTHTIHLRNANGEESVIRAATIVCATGWNQQPTLKFENVSGIEDIGWVTLSRADDRVRAADTEILSRFPELRDRPATSPESNAEVEQDCWSLYRGMIPLGFLKTHNFAWAGMSLSLRGCLCAEIQALWIIAFLDGKVDATLPSREQAEWQPLLQSRFYWWKAPMGMGGSRTDMAFETMPYIDTLIKDLGLKPGRKRSWWREIFEWYGVDDFRGIVDEWLRNSRRVK